MSEKLTEEQLQVGYPRLYSLLMTYRTPFHLSIWDRELAEFFNQDSPREIDTHTLKPLYESFLLNCFDAFKPLEIAMYLQRTTHFDLLLANETARADFNSNHNAYNKMALQKSANASGNHYFISRITAATSSPPEHTSARVQPRFFDGYSTPPRNTSGNTSMQTSRAGSACLSSHSSIKYSENGTLSPLPPPFDMRDNLLPDAAPNA